MTNTFQQQCFEWLTLARQFALHSSGAWRFLNTHISQGGAEKCLWWDALVQTRKVQPVATCRQSPDVHKPAIVKLLLLI